MSKQRITFVVEYDKPEDCPAVSANMEVAGGKVVAVAFGDEMARLEKLEARLGGMPGGH